jgi:hypothetical protein
MSRLDLLLKQYKDFIGLPWKANLSPSERVIFLVYAKTEERRVEALVPEFELATRERGHGWTSRDVSGEFSAWIASHDYREEYFKKPHLIHGILDDAFMPHLIGSVHGNAASTGPNDVFAITGTSGLFGFVRLSEFVSAVASLVRGRLVVFFPGEYENSNYRFLDARDGWSYLAVPLTGQGDL